MADIGSMVVRILGDNSDFDKKIDASEKKYLDFAKSLANIGKKLTTFVTLPILGIGIAAVKSAGDMEMQAAAFETMLGSAKAAQKMLTDLRVMAAKTPFQLTDLAQASKILLSFGYDADKVLPTIRQLGDVAGGNADRFQSLSLAFAQVQATGRLMGQDLLQMINAGFNPLQQIAEDTGQSMADLKEAMEDGAISAEMVAGAFASATEEGGRFFGGMERASQTLNGQWSTLMDTVAELGRSFAEILLPAIKNIIGAVSKFAGLVMDLDDANKRLILTIAGIAAAIGPLMFGIGKLIPMVHALTAAISAHPYIALAIAVIGITAAIAKYVTEVKKAHDTTLGLSISWEEMDKKFNPIKRAAEDAAFEFRFLVDELNQATVGSKEMTAIEKKLATAVDDLARKYKVQKGAVLEAIQGTQQLNIEYETQTGVYKTLGELIGIAAKEQETQTQGQKDYAVALKNISDGYTRIAQEVKLAAATEAEYNEMEQRQKVLLAEIAKLREKGYQVEGENIQGLIAKYKALNKIETTAFEERTESILGIEQLDAESISKMAEFREAEHQAELKRIKEEEDKRKAAADHAIALAHQVSIELVAFASALTTRRLELLRRETDAREAAYNAELTRDDAALKAQLGTLDAELAAVLQAAGVAEKTKIEQLQAQLAAAKEAGDAEKVAALESALKREQIVADFEMRRTALIVQAEADRVAKQKAFDDEIAANRREIARKEAIASKTYALFDIALNTAVAMSRAGTVWGAVAAGVIGAAQALAVAAKPLPELAEGGIVPPRPGGTLARFAEAGQTEVIFPLDRLEEFLTRREGGREFGGARGDEGIPLRVQVNLDSRPILDAVTRGSRNRTVLIDAGAVVGA